MSDSILDTTFFLNSEMSLRWAITLLHFLWQGCLIGLAAMALSRLFRNQSATLRYWLHSIALLACPTCVAITFSLVTVPESLPGNRSTANEQAHSASERQEGGESLPVDVPYPALIPPRANSLPIASTDAVSEETNNAATVRSLSANESSSTSTNAKWYRTIATWATVAYVIGVVCFLLRLSVALWGGHRLRAIAIPLADFALLDLIRNQASRIGLRIVPIVAYCERVAVPTVIGVLRPIVLLPASVMTGLTTGEFSAIISHEFAHIRRYDLWMNLLQRLIESLLFFHPVVWFLSRCLSAEREICCDDLVVRSGHEAMNYAGALLRMAELCGIPRHQNVAALTATGRSMSLLERRIGRLINAQPEPRLQLTRMGVLTLILTLVSFLAAPGIVRSWAAAQQPAVAEDSSESNTGTPNEQELPENEGDTKATSKSATQAEDAKVTISGRIVLEDGSSATTKGWMYNHIKSGNGGFIGAVDQFVDHFSFTCPAGTVWVSYFADGFAPAWTEQFEMKSGEVRNDFTIVLKPGRSKRIRVINKEGRSVSDAKLVAHPEMHGERSGPVDPKLTDEKGELWLEHLAESPYAFRIEAKGYQTLRSESVDVSSSDVLEQVLIRSDVTNGVILNSDGTPAAAAKLLANVEVYENGNANSIDDPSDAFWGTSFAITDSEGRFKLDQLSSTSHYLFIIQTADGARAVISDIRAGQKDLKITVPRRRDLNVTIQGDTSEILQRQGKPFLSVRQRVDLRSGDRQLYGALMGGDAFIEVNETGGTAVFRGLAVDLSPDAPAQKVEISLGYDKDLSQTVPINLNGETKVTFELPEKKAAPVPEAIAAKSKYEQLPIQWGESVSGLRIGAMFVDAPAYGVKSFKTIDEAHLQLYVQNVSKENVLCQFPLPHPQDGWGLNIENKSGTDLHRKQILETGETSLRIFSAELAPREIQPMTGKLEKYHETKEGLGNGAEIEHVKFKVASTLSESGELQPPFTYGFSEGQFTAQIFARFRRSDIPNETVNLETVRVSFEVGSVAEASRILHPHCVVQVENLLNRPLIEAISLFNFEAKESPIGSSQPRVTEKETRDAIAKLAEQPHVPEAVKGQLGAMLKSSTLPSNAYFRRFTRFDDGKQMNDVWWVRLVVQPSEGGVFSVPVRTTAISSRPYTQMERQQNAADGMTLIGRVSSYYENPPVKIEQKPLDKAMVDRLATRSETALKGKDFDALKALFEPIDGEHKVGEFAESELKTLLNAKIHSVKVTPRTLEGNLITWSAWQKYKPNLPVVGYLEIEYSEEMQRKMLMLELGRVGDELKLVNYVPDGDRKPPESLNPGPSITGHLEQLADGTFLLTDIITNPGTLLSAHLANEEIRLRDFQKE